ncbi:MAG: tRNA uracil 4-sulfurtransferase ThiI [Thermoprotei archaeon]
MSSKWIILVRYGELSIKGATTRQRMIRRLLNNIVDALDSNDIGYGSVRIGYGGLYIDGFSSEEDALKAIDPITRVMGVVNVIPAYRTKYGSLEELASKALEYAINRVRGSSFAVRARRIGKHEFTSLDIARVIGEILRKKTGLRVDLENPDYELYVEVRGSNVFFYDTVYRGPGGLPIGVTGHVLSLLSGGIDSPVAAWFMLKRGCRVDYVLFNLGGKEQVESVKRVAWVLANRWSYGYYPHLYVVDLRKLIPRIALYSPEEYLVIILRRAMVRIASLLADKLGAKALVTGESLGQVASQTLDNLVVIDKASGKTVLRPLIGFDKEEIVRYARAIGTYEYSIKVREYCPMGARRVATRADPAKIREIEEKAGLTDNLFKELLDGVESINLRKMVVVEEGTSDTGERCKL